MTDEATTRLFSVGSCQVSATVDNGTGDGPPVVFVSALGDSSAEWDDVRRHLGSRAPVVTYGRPGLDGSGPLPDGERDVARPISWAAGQLHDLLDVMGLEAPVLVGHSIGGQIIERYVYAWPSELAGLVLVDASDMRIHQEQDPLLRDGDDGGPGILFDVRSSQQEYDAAPNRPVACPSVVLSSAVGRWHRAKQPDRYLPLTLSEVDAMWQEAQQRFARELGAALVTAHTAGHRLEAETPALVAYVVDAVVQAARNNQAEPSLLEDQLDARGGYRTTITS